MVGCGAACGRAHERAACGASGESLKGALQVLKTFQIRRCPHKKATDACSCVMDLLGPLLGLEGVTEAPQWRGTLDGGGWGWAAGAKNEHHYVIATVDPKLMKRLAEKPGVPVVTVLGNRPVLLKPSAATLRDVAQVGRAGFSPHGNAET